ncbi:MAG: hypothetical protein FJ211_10135 [Ignavibacteria bacterium]|nr:hypothetical protein [Ignavibacteria bacterium]
MAEYYYGRMGSLVFKDDDNASAVERTIARVTNWSIETTVDVVEAQTMDMDSKRRFPIASSSSGSCTALYYRTKQDEDIFVILQKAMHDGSKTVGINNRFTLKLKTGSAARDELKCKVYITTASIQCATSEMTTIALSFTVDEIDKTFGLSAP